MNDEEPQNIPRLPEVAKVMIEDRRNPFPRTAVVQVVDYYKNDERENEASSLRNNPQD